MIKAIPVKIALQGGGAKLMPMLAVAEAIYELQQRKELELTGLAGTSAGAIVAAILALGANPRSFAQKLSDNGESYIARITGKYDKYPGMRAQKFLRATFFSKSFADVHELRKVLFEVFSSVVPEFSEDTPIGAVKLQDELENSLRIVVSDLSRSKKSVIGSSSHANHSLLDAIVHSCALPIFFRNRASLTGSSLVDGGLYNNFPVEEICDDPNANLLGITFDQPEGPPNINSAIGYLLHLLLSTIDQSVKQSTDAVGPNDIISIKTDITTLDFRKALGASPGSTEYENTKKLAFHDLQEYIKLKNSREKDRTVVDLIRDNQKIYDNHHLNSTRRHIKLGLISTLYSLAKAGEPLYSDYSEFTIKSQFSAKDAPVYAQTLGSYESVHSSPLTGLLIRVTDENKKEMGFTQIPGLNVARLNGEERECIASLVYFDTPILPNENEKAYVEVSRTHYELDGTASLATNGVEERKATLQIENVTDIPYEEALLIVHVPTSYPDLEASSNNELTFDKLTEEEMDNFSSTPAGFKSIGWKTLNLCRDTPFSLKIRPKNDSESYGYKDKTREIEFGGVT